MIPVLFLKKMDIYDVEVNGAKVKVSVINGTSVIDDKLSELERFMKIRVVGLDYKVEAKYPSVLALCVGTRCLLIHLGPNVIVPYSLRRFLNDKSICFVGEGMKKKVDMMISVRSYPESRSSCGTVSMIDCQVGIEVGYLGARVLKKPEICKYGLTKMAGELGIDIKVPVGGSGSSEARNTLLYTEEQIKHLIHDAYVSYAIGSKLLGSL